MKFTIFTIQIDAGFIRKLIHFLIKQINNVSKDSHHTLNCIKYTNIFAIV